VTQPEKKFIWTQCFICPLTLFWTSHFKIIKSYRLNICWILSSNRRFGPRSDPFSSRF
jgi:hypothetical protein